MDGTSIWRDWSNSWFCFKRNIRISWGSWHLTKIKGSRNKHNVARATVEALKLLRTAEEIAALRGLEVKDILS